MPSLGVVEVLDMKTSFDSEVAKPAMPGAGRSATIGLKRSPSRRSDLSSRLGNLIDENLAMTLQSARFTAEAYPSSTTFASLAQAEESAGNNDNAITNALKALELCAAGGDRANDDPFAARLSLEVLLRADMLDEVLAFVPRLSISSQFQVELAAILGWRGRFTEAMNQLHATKSPEREAVQGFLLLMQGEDNASVPFLRSALRRDPEDADTALNLSIALWNLGSKRKSLNAAMQARKVASGREDILSHSLELLLAEGQPARVDAEMRDLIRRGLEPSARLLILQARARIALDDVTEAVRILDRASAKATRDADTDLVAEINSNSLRLRANLGKLDREEAVARLVSLHAEYPTADVVVANLGQVVWRRAHAQSLRAAFADIEEQTTPARAAFLRYQLATLEGNNSEAADRALEWVDLEPSNGSALTAAMVAIGIGEERWNDAARYAMNVVNSGSSGTAEVNNAAYILSMAGLGDVAVDLLSSHLDGSFIMTATLGLSYLASGDIDRGMRLYREAAQAAEKRQDDSRSLMTAYQALVVRQLGLQFAADPTMVSALSLPAFPLPDNWQDRPEFLRLHKVALRHGYDWPLSVS